MDLTEIKNWDVRDLNHALMAAIMAQQLERERGKQATVATIPPTTTTTSTTTTSYFPTKVRDFSNEERFYLDENDDSGIEEYYEYTGENSNVAQSNIPTLLYSPWGKIDVKSHLKVRSPQSEVHKCVTIL